MGRPHSRIAALLLLLLVAAVSVQAKVITGLDVLAAENFDRLRGKRVGVITNHTGVDAKGRSIIELLSGATGVTLAAIFSPEHGFTGRARDGAVIGDDRWKDIPIYSLYGKTHRPTVDMLAGLDALVFDIQDIGARFYTYITTMGYALEECANSGIEFYVLDRPNPVTGRIVEGEILDPAVRHFTAYFSVPVRHGMTVGEIAQWHNTKSGLKAKLRVVRMEGWARGWWDETGLRFLPPSPNIRTPRAALLYSGIGAFEATNISVGRGTGSPFEVFGAPWLDGRELARRLNDSGLSGVVFKPARFVPKGDNRYAGEVCRGVRVQVKDREAVRPVDIFILASFIIRDLAGEKFVPRWNEMPRVTGTERFREFFQTGAAPEKLLTEVYADVEKFMWERKPFLLYSDEPIRRRER